MLLSFNYIHTQAGRKLIQEFEEALPHMIDERGIYPLPMMVLTARGIDVVKLELEDHQACDTFAKAVKHPEVEAAILGIDRYGDPAEMKTELHDVLTCTLYEKDNPLVAQIRVRDQFRFGIIEYKDSPRAVRKINWSNRFWIQEMKSELFRYVPDVILGQEGSVLMGPDMHRMVQ